MFFAAALSAWHMEGELERTRGHIGVRMPREVMSAQQKEALWDEEGAEDLPDLTLWKQTEEESIRCGELGSETRVKTVDVWGDAEQIYPDCLMAGAALIREDAKGCMLSGKAAYELFGGLDVIGKQVEYAGQQGGRKGKTYIVRGLLDLEESVFLRENKEASFTNLEADGKPGEGTEKIRQILMKAGALPEEGAVIETDTFCGLLRIIRLVCGLVLLGSLYRNVKHWPVRAALAAGAAALVWGSWGFSADFIPSRWSDFEFFSALAEEQVQNFRRYGDIMEIYRDGVMFGCFRASAIMMVIAAAAGAVLPGMAGRKPK